jgi:hypothetical protein
MQNKRGYPMATIEQTVENYVASWNETDARRRRALIDQTWTGDARYVDPLMRGDSPSEIDVLLAGVQQRFPGHEMRLAGPVDAHHDRVWFETQCAARLPEVDGSSSRRVTRRG